MSTPYLFSCGGSTHGTHVTIRQTACASGEGDQCIFALGEVRLYAPGPPSPPNYPRAPPPPPPPLPPHHPPPPPRDVPSIIFDTDMSIDTDDVGALCTLHALVDNGEARLLAITHGVGLEAGIGAISSVNAWYGRDDGSIPIGVYKGEIGNPEHTPEAAVDRRHVGSPEWINQANGWYAADLRDEFSGRYHGWWDENGDREMPSSVQVMRETLANADDHSITIVAVGHATNLHGLITSPADMGCVWHQETRTCVPPTGALTLNGNDLVSLKVKEVVWMGGGNPSREAEWNFAACVEGCGAYSQAAH